MTTPDPAADHAPAPDRAPDRAPDPAPVPDPVLEAAPSRHPVPQVDVAGLRETYRRGQLVETDVDADPVVQFSRWLADAVAARVPEPNAMTLATADADGVPSARVVLLKDVDQAGMTFYTNAGSAKGHDLAANPRAALVFCWLELERQVRVSGAVTPVARVQSAAYFASRPRASQLGAWASHQSSVVSSRGELEAAQTAAAERFDGTDVPLPAFWGGWRVDPVQVEFWQGRPGRLHDRLRYRRRADGAWLLERLAP